MRSLNAAQAYQKATTHRSVRDQEADVFRLVNATLRRADPEAAVSRARAIADNERLWITVMDIVRDPLNRLPDALRAGLVSLGHSVRRETSSPNPDVAFMINVNEQIAAGLVQG